MTQSIEFKFGAGPSPVEIDDSLSSLLRKLDWLKSKLPEKEGAIEELCDRLSNVHLEFLEVMRLNETLVRQLEAESDARLDLIARSYGISKEEARSRRIGISEYFRAAGIGSSDGMELGSVKRRFARLTEAYYYAASLLWDMSEGDVFERGKAKFIGVKMVRNILLEHNMRSDPRSFAYSSGLGPTVKPSRAEEEAKFPMDCGLTVNHLELLRELQSRCQARKDEMLGG